MNKVIFDAERAEVRAAVLILVLSMMSIWAGLAQVRIQLKEARPGVAQIVQSAGWNLERRR